MKAAYYEQFQQPNSIQNLPTPIPESGEVVIRTKATGICRSDWHGWMGHDSDVYLPHVPGHELAGIVEAIGKGVENWQRTAPSSLMLVGSWRLLLVWAKRKVETKRQKANGKQYLVFMLKILGVIVSD